MNSYALRLALLGALAFALPATATDFGGTVDTTLNLPPAAGVLKVGNMVVRLDRFTELRDGKVQAEMSFYNLDREAAAYFVLNAKNTDASLHNGDGAPYRLLGVSQFADTQSESGWTTVAPGGSAALTATFDAEDIQHGVQPFALRIPMRLKWRSADAQLARVRSFDVNFGGLRRQSELARAEMALIPDPVPVEHVEAMALQPLKSPPPLQAHTSKFNDDLAPQVAALPTARADGRRYLFAIGVNAYDDAPSVPFADRSAQLMTDLLRKRYGVPEENITLITGDDATGLKILGRLNSLVQRLTPGDTVFFYYAGHGLSGRDGKAVYVVPKDAVPGAYEVEMLSLSSLLGRFESSPAARIVAFLDTCFSGRVSGDKSLFPGVAPLVPTEVSAADVQSKGKVTLFLAGQANQFANDYPERGHRLFSYFLIKGLLRGSDNATEIHAAAAREVRRISAKRGAEFLQEPRLEGAATSVGSFIAVSDQRPRY
ncbi:MAG: caspase domain-containing protein [Rhodospirillaceae bacterium]